MKFVKYLPAERLRPYIKYLVISAQERENEYKVLPSPGLVIGFQYQGELALSQAGLQQKLDRSGITGISDSYKIFKSSAHIGTVLVYFTETGFAHFASHPANELFNLSLSLHDIFSKQDVSIIEEKLSAATTDQQRINLIERFLISQLREIDADKLIVEAVRLIYDSQGTIRIKELNDKLMISASPFEKRFRKVVGTSAKKFAAIVRFNAVVDQLGQTKSLSEICYGNHFFDQSHFIRDFRQFSGDTPENFRRPV